MCCYFGAKQNTSLHFKIVNGGGNFVRYAVAESATDAAERGQRVLAHFAEPQGGKACKAGLAYLAYVSIYATSKVQNLPARTIFKKRDAFLTKRISCI